MESGKSRPAAGSGKTDSSGSENVEYRFPTPEAAQAAAPVLAAQLNQIPGGKAAVEAGGSGAGDVRLRVHLQGNGGYQTSARSCAERLAKWMERLALI